jgi:hypothetical protein
VVADRCEGLNIFETLGANNIIAETVSIKNQGSCAEGDWSFIQYKYIRHVIHTHSVL